MPAYGYGSTSYGTVNAGTAVGVQQLAAANPNRKYMLITNDGSNVVYLRFGTAEAGQNEGIRLGAGGTYEMKRSDGNLWGGQINVRAVTGASKVIYMEGS